MLFTFHLKHNYIFLLILIMISLSEEIIKLFSKFFHINKKKDFDSDYPLIYEISKICFISFYFFEKKSSKTNRSFLHYVKFFSMNNNREIISKKNFTIFIFFLSIFLLNFIYIFLSKKITLVGHENFFFFIFCYFLEIRCEKKEIYNHHIISISINILFALIILYLENSYSFSETIYFLLQTYSYILSLFLIKYLNTYFYLSLFLIVSLTGFSNLIINIIFSIIKGSFQTTINSEFQLSSILILIYNIVYLFCFYSIVLHIGTIHAITSKCISYFIVLFFDILFFDESENENDEDSDEVMSEFYLFIISIISSLIYLEIIQLNFCGLNKNTQYSIDKRGKKEESDIENSLLRKNQSEFEISEIIFETEN